jgi:hypothetical protein
VPTPVEASFDRTWEAVVAHFARHAVALRAVDRGAGLITAGPIRVSGSTARVLSVADCGGGTGYLLAPGLGTYDVAVRGDGARATVAAAVWFVTGERGVECVSKGVWEAELEAAIKARAEARRARR